VKENKKLYSLEKTFESKYFLILSLSCLYYCSNDKPISNSWIFHIQLVYIMF